MSKLVGQCPDCSRILIQEYAAGGHIYCACMGGHAWRISRGKLFARQHEPPEEESPRQIVTPAAQWEAVIPKQPEWLRWIYGHI